MSETEEKMNIQELDILSRIDRIIFGANERELDETEVRTLRDAKWEIVRLRKSLSARAMDDLSQLDEELGLQ